MGAKIVHMGAYTPNMILDNAYFENILNTSDEWIQTRTGIKQRRKAEEDEFTTDLCEKAALQMINDNGIDLSDVDFIIAASSTQEHPIPSIASQLQYKLKIKNAGAIDLIAACAGFTYGVILAKHLINSGTYKKILVFGADNLTRFTDYTDRTTCILFGDGAGVALIEHSDNEKIGNSVTGTEGQGGKELFLSYLPVKLNGVDIINNNKIHQNGKAVYKWATQIVPAKVGELLSLNNITLDEIDWFIPHSANLRMIELIVHTIKLPMEKVLESVQYYGNTSAATIPIALYHGIKDGKVKPGDKLLLVGFGGGLTYAGTIITW